MKKRLKIFSVVGIFLVVAMLAITILPSLAEAGSLQVVRMSLSSNVASTTPVDFSVIFQTPTLLVATDKILVTFRNPAGFDVATDGDISGTTTVNQGAGDPPGALVALASATGAEGAAAADTWEFVLDAGVTITANNYVSVAVTAELTNPAVDGPYIIDIQTLTAADVVIDSASAALVIGTNQVQISGTVDPTLTLALGDFEAGFTNACPLGTLEVTKLAACGYSVTVTTNAVSGYSTYIRQDHALWNLADNSKVIAAVADGAVTPGGTPTSEEYGLAVATPDTNGDFGTFVAADGCIAGADPIRDRELTGQAAEAITGADQVLSSHNAPVDGTTQGKSYLCHVARRYGATVAGNYGQTVTITAVGNF